MTKINLVTGIGESDSDGPLRPLQVAFAGMGNVAVIAPFHIEPCPYHPQCIGQFNFELRGYCSKGGTDCRTYKLNELEKRRRD